MKRLLEINYPTSFIEYLTAETVITTYADNITIDHAWNTILDRANTLVIGEGVVSIVSSFNHADSEIQNVKLPSTLRTITNSFLNFFIISPKIKPYLLFFLSKNISLADLGLIELFKSVTTSE